MIDTASIKARRELKESNNFLRQARRTAHLEKTDGLGVFDISCIDGVIAHFAREIGLIYKKGKTAETIQKADELGVAYLKAINECLCGAIEGVTSPRFGYAITRMYQQHPQFVLSMLNGFANGDKAQPEAIFEKVEIINCNYDKPPDSLVEMVDRVSEKYMN